MIYKKKLKYFSSHSLLLCLICSIRIRHIMTVPTVILTVSCSFWLILSKHVGRNLTSHTRWPHQRKVNTIGNLIPSGLIMAKRIAYASVVLTDISRLYIMHTTTPQTFLDHYLYTHTHIQVSVELSFDSQLRSNIIFYSFLFRFHVLFSTV